MGQYSDYNIIPLGDHCATSILLKELNLRYKSYPFDWVNQLHDTNIMYNIQLINDLTSSDTVDDIVKSYIGDAFDTDSKVNSSTTIWFPHDTESKAEVFEKYKRRFSRLKEDLHKKNSIYIINAALLY